VFAAYLFAEISHVDKETDLKMVATMVVVSGEVGNE
jgi:hypothetical protein